MHENEAKQTPEWQLRVMAERKDLAGKVQRLGEFLEASSQRDGRKHELLLRQHRVMEAYLKVLDARMEGWPGAVRAGVDLASGPDSTVYAVPADASFRGTDRELRLRYGIPESAAIVRLKPRMADVRLPDAAPEKLRAAMASDVKSDTVRTYESTGEIAAARRCLHLQGRVYDPKLDAFVISDKQTLADLNREMRDETSPAPAEVEAAETESLAYRLLQLENEMLRRHEQIRTDTHAGMQTLASQLGAMVHNAVQAGVQGDALVREAVSAQEAFTQGHATELNRRIDAIGEFVTRAVAGEGCGYDSTKPAMQDRLDTLEGRVEKLSREISGHVNSLGAHPRVTQQG